MHIYIYAHIKYICIYVYLYVYIKQVNLPFTYVPLCDINVAKIIKLTFLPPETKGMILLFHNSHKTCRHALENDSVKSH